MPLTLYAHPFSSYCQKVLTALYENDTPHQLRLLDNAETGAEFAALWPIKRMPVLLDDGRTVVESSIIIEYLQLHHPGPVRLIPADANEALDVRFMDRFFDQYVMTPMQRIVADHLRPMDKRDPQNVQEGRDLLDAAYAWLEQRLAGRAAGRAWASGEAFSLADCAAAPSLFYADWAHRIPERFQKLRAYRQRLLERPSFARAVNGARPYRPLFPMGAPDRD